VNKPVGMTSHDVVDRVRRAVGQRSVGHAGTLDPLAGGVLVLGIGRATKLCGYLSDAQKTYRATVTLGTTSKTFDAEGVDDDSVRRPVPDLSWDELAAVVKSFEGEIEQTVPLYSAVRRGGVRLYQMARKGKSVEAPTRTVEISSIRVVRYDSPDFEMDITCSKGTYVRSLAHEIGQRVGCGAYLSGLVRMASGRFSLEDAITLEDIEASAQTAKLHKLLVPLEQLLDWPEVRVTETFRERIRQGRPLRSADVERVDGDFHAGDSILLKAIDGTLLAVGTATADAAAFNREADNSLFDYARVLS
jgi:tRNA pseudouridine55 synthase